VHVLKFRLVWAVGAVSFLLPVSVAKTLLGAGLATERVHWLGARTKLIVFLPYLVDWVDHGRRFPGVLHDNLRFEIAPRLLVVGHFLGSRIVQGGRDRTSVGLLEHFYFLIKFNL
jgi:hypothetical protein